MTFERGESVFGRYVIEEQIGKGGMGEVFRATHQSLQMPVAIKTLTLLDDEEGKARFEREARVMAQLRHPNLASILDYGIHKGVPCIAMEFINGGDLEQLRQREGTAIPWRRAVDLMRGILRGLAAIHRAGMVHRDMKASNVMLLADDPEAVKVVDFGIARPLDPESYKLTATGLAVGTPAYMAPEQLFGNPAVAQSDLYAAGLVLYEMLTGHVPFSESLREIIRRTKELPPEPQAPPHLPQLPDGLVSFFRTALAISPDERFGSANEMADRLRDAVAAVPTAGILRRRRRTPSPTPTPSQPEAAPTVARTTPAPVPAPTDSTATPRFVFAVSFPPSVLRRKEERRFLGDALGRAHRSFMFAGRFWLGVIQADSEEQAQAVVDELFESLQSRYADVAEFTYTAVRSNFELSAGSLSGLQPLPDALENLLAQLA